MTWEILTGDVRDMLPTLKPKSVQCVVTSPPYYGLRDYGSATWEGGDAECDHVAKNARNDVTPERLAERAAKYQTGQGTGSHVTTMQYRNTCGKCGAIRIDKQMGLEPTLTEYITGMVEVFRLVRDVLKDDGVVWLNIGDSYNAGRDGGHAGGMNGVSRPSIAPQRSGANVPGLKPKDLMMVPARLAIALQDDGWYLRSDIIWHKPNPMPESVTDRPTSSHEHIFLLTKSARYYYDADAIAEDVTPLTTERVGKGFKYSGIKCDASRNDGDNAGHHLGDGATRNARNVWQIATAPFSGAHFAVFPPEIPRRCILAGSQPGDTILDPFAGAGTTLLVADRLQRNAIGIELNPTYADMARKRIYNDAPLLMGFEL